MYSCNTLYIGKDSGLIFNTNQVSLEAHKTICGKHMFDQFFQTCGVTMQHHHGDNGVFKTNAYWEDLQKHNQLMTFSGFGAHRRNGVAKQNIQTVSESARSMLTHAALHWPEYMDKIFCHLHSITLSVFSIIFQKHCLVCLY